MLTSSYSSSLTILMITYGIFGGFGLGLMYVPAVVAVSQYFNKRLNLATGMNSYLTVPKFPNLTMNEALKISNCLNVAENGYFKYTASLFFY